LTENLGFLGAEVFVDIGGDVGWVYLPEGAESDVGSGAGCYGAREEPGSDVVARYAECNDGL